LSLRFLSAFSRNFSASLPRKVGISLITIAMIVDSNLLIIRNYNLRSAMSITLIQINVYLSLTHEITNFDMNPVSIITNFDMFLVISFDFSSNKKSPRLRLRLFCWSGWRDSNSRPLAPHAGIFHFAIFRYFCYLIDFQYFTKFAFGFICISWDFFS
jgi:hypothetical protein